jgi:VRR-NUC domain
MSLPPLLMLAEGRKPRLRRAPTIRPRELALHFAVVATLRKHCCEDWRWFHVPNGELRDTRTAAKLKAMGLRPGVPDLVLVSPYGSVRFLELKRLGESLSDAQEQFCLWYVKHSVPHCVAYSFDQAIAALDRWGCLRHIWKLSRALRTVPSAARLGAAAEPA